MIHPIHMRREVVSPTLRTMGMWSQEAENLLMGTIAQESEMGRWLVQINGPALGICQMEPSTHNDIIYNYLARKPELWKALLATSRATRPSHHLLIVNLAYAVAMARLHYWRKPEPLPEAHDVDGLAAYWKRHYNTPKGKGTEAQFKSNYARYVLAFGDH